MPDALEELIAKVNRLEAEVARLKSRETSPMRLLYVSPTYPNTLNSYYAAASDGDAMWLNYVGYQGGSARFRDTVIANGKQDVIARFYGGSKETGFNGLTRSLAASLHSQHELRSAANWNVGAGTFRSFEVNCGTEGHCYMKVVYAWTDSSDSSRTAYCEWRVTFYYSNNGIYALNATKVLSHGGGAADMTLAVNTMANYKAYPSIANGHNSASILGFLLVEAYSSHLTPTISLA